MSGASRNRPLEDLLCREEGVTPVHTDNFDDCFFGSWLSHGFNILALDLVYCRLFGPS